MSHSIRTAAAFARPFRGPRNTAPSTKRSSGIATFRPVNACVTAIRAIMTMPPFSAALSSNPIASSHSGFRCVASASAVM
jgi:hypothetical protein